MIEHDAFYNTKRWHRLRKSVLRRDGYIDRIAWRFGKKVEATHVHHIFPREDFPEFQWEPWNLISVSASSHNALHDRNTNALTEEGRELLERTARRLGIEIKKA